PADPYGLLAAVERLFQLRTVLDDPPIDRGMIHVHTPFEHEFFDVARAQRIGQIPADSRENDGLGGMGSLEADRHTSSPWQHGPKGETIPQVAANENLRQNRIIPYQQQGLLAFTPQLLTHPLKEGYGDLPDRTALYKAQQYMVDVGAQQP